MRTVIDRPVQALLDEALAANLGSGYGYSFGDSARPTDRGVGGTDRHGGQVVRDDMFWDVASVTKTLVATASARLMEAGQIDLEQSVDRFLGDFRGGPSSELTVRQLLSHSGGLPGKQELYRTCGDSGEIRAAVRKIPLHRRPDAAVEYTCVGFMVLGWIIEAVTAEPLDRSLEDLVFEPFGIGGAHFRASDAAAAGTISTERCPWRDRLIHGVVHDENAWVMGGTAGNAGLFMTLADVETFATTWLRAHRGDGDQPLRPETARDWATNQVAEQGRARGLGWQLAADPDAAAGGRLSPGAFGHTGFTGTSLYLDPELDFYGVLLTNRVHPSRDDDRIASLRNRFYDVAVGTGGRVALASGSPVGQ